MTPATELAASLKKTGLEIGRLRTDTTPRLHFDTIDWAALDCQKSIDEPQAFSHFGEKRVYSGMVCGLTRTNAETHKIIRKYFEQSPLYMGRLETEGPRYCPSIDDKIIKFPEKDTHPIFLEPITPEGREVYVQNFSTSMCLEAQFESVRTIKGCERAHILRPGYAIEYDFVVPTQLHPWLETKPVKNLFLAGQINGTSGYEEAAGQGLVAGINAALRVRGEAPFVLGRDESYIGVSDRRPRHEGDQRALQNAHEPLRIPPAAAPRQRRRQAVRQGARRRPAPRMEVGEILRVARRGGARARAAARLQDTSLRIGQRPPARGRLFAADGGRQRARASAPPRGRLAARRGAHRFGSSTPSSAKK